MIIFDIVFNNAIFVIWQIENQYMLYVPRKLNYFIISYYFKLIVQYKSGVLFQFI